MQEGGQFRYQGIATRRDGSNFDVEVHGVAFYYRNTLHVLRTVWDVTERNRVQAMLEQRVAARARELAALYDVTAVASGSLDVETVLDRSLEGILEVMGNKMGGIYLLDEERGELRPLARRGLPLDIVEAENEVTLGQQLAERVFESGEPLVVPDLGADARVLLPASVRLAGKRAYVGAPMRAKGRVLGVLSVVGEAERQFNAEEVALLASIADQVGMVVENARLYQQAEQLAVMEERQRLARELHDAATQSLYSITLLAETARRAASAGDLEQVKGYARRLGQVSQQALKEMRLLVYELRPPLLEREGLVGALQQRLDAVEGRARVKARLLVDGEAELPPAIEEALYRIAQEALNNTLKHGSATRVTVRLRSKDGGARLVIADNGSGFELDAVARDRGGMGLTSMRERAEALGGDFDISSAVGEGTQVEVRFDAVALRGEGTGEAGS
jgi:signal transduction histidine kinase